MGELLGRRRLERVHGDALGIEPGHHVLDHAVLARRVERLEHDDDAVGLLRGEPGLELEQALDALVEPLLRRALSCTPSVAPGSQSARRKCSGRSTRNGRDQLLDALAVGLGRHRGPPPCGGTAARVSRRPRCRAARRRAACRPCPGPAGGRACRRAPRARTRTPTRSAASRSSRSRDHPHGGVTVLAADVHLQLVGALGERRGQLLHDAQDRERLVGVDRRRRGRASASSAWVPTSSRSSSSSTRIASVQADGEVGAGTDGEPEQRRAGEARLTVSFERPEPERPAAVARVRPPDAGGELGVGLVGLGELVAQ